ncbi:MAG TPA: TPM domain-containing protein [Methylocystis sp.]|nr:TPM domain-containing protein [Methylocystis sp.]
MPITKSDFARVAEAIRAAERRTGAEIVCVLARRCSNYSYVPVLWAAFVALATPWPFVLFTHWPVRWLLELQIAVFIVAALVLSSPAIVSLLTPRRVQRSCAHRAAVEQFFTRGVGRTSNRAGVLIFASLAERYARIVADVGVADKITEAEWAAALDLLRGELREGRIAEGYIAAIEEAARLLAPHVPPKEKDELPDRLYVM